MDSFLTINRSIVERLTRDYLSLIRTSGSAAPAGMLAHAVFDEIAGALATEYPPACAPECGYCCHVKVNLNPSEAFALARHVCDLPSEVRAGVAARLGRAVRETRGLTSRDRWAMRLACPLLSDQGMCVAYEARPLACRAHVSYDSDACRRDFESQEDVGVPTLQEFLQYRGMIWSALSLAERQLTGQLVVLELIASLQGLLAEAELEKNWLGGRDVLADAVDADATERRQSVIEAAGF